MTTVRDLPRAVREIEHFWVPLSDGTRLAARGWIPEDARDRPVPALLESIPYRKRDFTRRRDEPMHRYLAGHGYASIRLDVRGTGDSEGLIRDEYTPREQEDNVEAIRWLARREWCTGSVGMFGISWGGFGALQAAARAPEPLDAIIAVCASDDRYTDDAHYMGGCLLNENLTWGSVFLNYALLPPDPGVVGDGWRDMWRDRLEGARLFPARWLRHPTRDAYWRQGSVRDAYDDIECPVFAVGGWADAYTNAVPRLLEGLSVPRTGLVGPWAHAYPHEASPGPRIGFLQEALRWWDRWLKGRETGIMSEPGYRVWMREPEADGGDEGTEGGRWVAEERWPSGRTERRELTLAGSGLATGGAEERRVRVRSPSNTGLEAGDWCPFGAPGERPGDQRADDTRSVTFDSEPLSERIEILGAPVLHAEVACDRRVAHLAARLCDVAPSGRSRRVTYGVLNLAHRRGHEAAEPMEPGRRYRIRVPLKHAAYAFPAGHRLRLALSTVYWPVVWPLEAPAGVDVTTGRSRLELPVRPERGGDRRRPDFPPAAAGRPLEYRRMREGSRERGVRTDAETGETVYRVRNTGAEFGGAARAHVPEIDLEAGRSLERIHRIRTGGAERAARSEVRQETVLGREGWRIRVDLHTRLHAGSDEFRIEADARARENGDIVWSRRWRESAERTLL